jgi:poly(3-hydroxybutyrate) depolymerase
VAAVGLSAGAGLAALLAFHHAARFDAVVTVAAPPLLGRANLQDPRKVMKEGLAISPTIATLLVERCAPLLVLHGADDDVVAPRCAEQLVAQALHVMKRADRDLARIDLQDGAEYRAGERLVLRHRLLPGLGHAWSGAPGGHAYVNDQGPPLTAYATAFLQETGVLAAAR